MKNHKEKQDSGIAHRKTSNLVKGKRAWRRPQVKEIYIQGTDSGTSKKHLEGTAASYTSMWAPS